MLRSKSINHSYLFLCVIILIFSAAEAAYNYTEVLQKSIYFYECQQAGPLPSWNRVEWRGDACIHDGSDAGVDLTGGWFDAGDHVKFNFPMAYTVTVLSWGVIEWENAYSSAGQLEHIRRNIRFAADYLLRCHTGSAELYGQVGKGSLDHAFWGPPESVEYVMERPAWKIDAQNPGSDLAGETAAALAAASIVFKESDPQYAEKLVSHAVELYAFADTYRGKYSESIPDAQGYYNSWSGYIDELVWGAIWLYRATGNTEYKTKAETLYDSLSTEPQTDIRSYRWTLAWDDKSYGCYVLMAELTDGAKYHEDAQRWLDWWSTGYDGGRITYTPGGLAWLDTWGANRYSANTSFCALIYSGIVNDEELKNRYFDFAKSQIDYMLGSNPNDRSYVVGFGKNPPQRPHHRGCHGYYPGQAADTIASRHILYGALVGGPENDDSYEDDRNNYINNEVACDYNAAFTGALARLSTEYGGTAVENFPEPEERTAEYFVEASVNVDGDRFTEIRSVVKNVTAWPPRGAGALSFRYFIDMSEAVECGFGAADFQITSNYSQGEVTLSSLIPWDENNNIYYLKIDLSGDTLFPGTQDSYKREVQFRIALPNDADTACWDPSNDWSFQELGVGFSELKKVYKIPVYESGNHVFGAEPGEDPVINTDDDALGVLQKDIMKQRFKIEYKAGSGGLFIRTDAHNYVKYTVYNLSGRNILSGKLTGKKGIINLKGISKGVYAVVLQNRNGFIKRGCFTVTEN